MIDEGEPGFYLTDDDRVFYVDQEGSEYHPNPLLDPSSLEGVKYVRCDQGIYYYRLIDTNNSEVFERGRQGMTEEASSQSKLVDTATNNEESGREDEACGHAELSAIQLVHEYDDDDDTPAPVSQSHFGSRKCKLTSTDGKSKKGGERSPTPRGSAKTNEKTQPEQRAQSYYALSPPQAKQSPVGARSFSPELALSAMVEDFREQHVSCTKGDLLGDQDEAPKSRASKTKSRDGRRKKRGGRSPTRRSSSIGNLMASHNANGHESFKNPKTRSHSDPSRTLMAAQNKRDAISSSCFCHAKASQVENNAEPNERDKSPTQSGEQRKNSKRGTRSPARSAGRSSPRRDSLVAERKCHSMRNLPAHETKQLRRRKLRPTLSKTLSRENVKKVSKQHLHELSREGEGISSNNPQKNWKASDNDNAGRATMSRGGARGRATFGLTRTDRRVSQRNLLRQHYASAQDRHELRRGQSEEQEKADRIKELEAVVASLQKQIEEGEVKSKIGVGAGKEQTVPSSGLATLDGIITDGKMAVNVACEAGKLAANVGLGTVHVAAGATMLMGKTALNTAVGAGKLASSAGLAATQAAAGAMDMVSKAASSPLVGT